MGTFILRALIGILTLILIVVTGIWLFLALPLFAQQRAGIVEDLLSEQLGQPLLVKDDVRVKVWTDTWIYVSGVEIPSENLADTKLAALELLELRLNLTALFKGKIDFDNLVVDGLVANLITLEDGTTSWSEADNDHIKSKKSDKPEETAQSDGERKGIIAFLSDRTGKFSNSALVIENRETGFNFDFRLDKLALEQLNNGELKELTGAGSVNTQQFDIDGTLPRGEEFSVVAKFGSATLSLIGTPLPEHGGFTAKFEMDTGPLSEFLKVLALEGIIEGDGALSADILNQNGALKVETFDANLELENGMEFWAEGAIGNLWEAAGLEIDISGRLHPEGSPPHKAESVREFRVSGFEMSIAGENEKLGVEELEISTNAFEWGLEKIGPISIGKIKRTPEGKLKLAQLNVQAGPPEAPYLKATGKIDDLLGFNDLELKGRATTPATIVLKTLKKEQAETFGSVQADFALDDSNGEISLTHLDAKTIDTDIWSLSAKGVLGEIKNLAKLDFSLEMSVEKTAEFLRALNLKPIDAGKISVGVALKGGEKSYTVNSDLNLGESSAKVTLDANFSEGVPFARGGLNSPRLSTRDLKNLIAVFGELSEMAPEKDKREAQPLVIVDDREAQPLVLEDEREAQPLVLSEDDKAGKDINFMDVETLLKEADLTFGVEVARLVGVKGVSQVSSALTAKNGKISFGPLNVGLGGGWFTVDAGMDALNSPNYVNVSGSASGWDIGDILDMAGLDMPAYGKISGNFSVSGNISNADTFMKTMVGNAQVSMGNGGVGTSLLELAGLGVFPWLFSNEFNQGRTAITCAQAPIKINRGQISTSNLVVDTNSVQLVVKGYLDFPRNRIAVRAEPRPLGRPLSRSAWPFNVYGALSDPQFKLEVGGSRSRRADGADRMPVQREPCKPDIYQLR